MFSGDYYSAGADQIIVMNIAAKSGKKYSAAMASRIFTNHAGQEELMRFFCEEADYSMNNQKNPIGILSNWMEMKL